MISRMRISSQRSTQARERQRQHVVREPGVDPRREEGRPAGAARGLELVAHVGDERRRMHHRHQRRRHDVLAGRQDAGHVLRRLEGPQVGRGGVADAVGVEREQRVGIGGRADARRRQTAQLAGVAAVLRRTAHPHAGQLQLRVADDGPERELPHVAGAPLDHAIRHGLLNRTASWSTRCHRRPRRPCRSPSCPPASRARGRRWRCPRRARSGPSASSPPSCRGSRRP